MQVSDCLGPVLLITALEILSLGLGCVSTSYSHWAFWSNFDILGPQADTMSSHGGATRVRLCPDYCMTCLKQAKFALYPVFGVGSMGTRFPLAMIQCAWCLERFILSRQSPYYPSGHRYICPQRPAEGYECNCTLALRAESSDSEVSSSEVSSTTGEDDTEEECWDDADRDYGQEAAQFQG